MYQKIRKTAIIILALGISLISTPSIGTYTPIMSAESFFSKLKFKPFQKSLAPAKVNDLNAKPVVLWTRMRNQFSLPAHENDARVKYYIKRFTTSQYHFNEMVNNARPYLFYIMEALEKYDMPVEIALLPMIESTYDPFAKSQSGARGLWQIMPETGKYYGLSRDDWFDGCQDVVLSTDAALRHLNYLQKRFHGDWAHALAAYNSGEGRVSRAINKNKKLGKATDFWSLPLPKQTRDYVPKLMALVIIIKNPSQYGVILPNVMNQPYFTQIDLGKAVDLKQAAKVANINEKTFLALNPGYHSSIMDPNGPFQVCVPIQTAKNFNHKVSTLSAIKINHTIQYTIKKGDTLIKIANKYKTTPQEIKKINKINKDVIVVGKTLKIPTQNITVEHAKKEKIHIVKSGESLWSISKKYKTNMKQILANNNIDKSAVLKPGQMIIIESA